MGHVGTVGEKLVSGCSVAWSMVTCAEWCSFQRDPACGPLAWSPDCFGTNTASGAPCAFDV